MLPGYIAGRYSDQQASFKQFFDSKFEATWCRARRFWPQKGRQLELRYDATVGSIATWIAIQNNRMTRALEHARQNPLQVAGKATVAVGTVLFVEPATSILFEAPKKLVIGTYDTMTWALAGAWSGIGWTSRTGWQACATGATAVQQALYGPRATHLDADIRPLLRAAPGSGFCLRESHKGALYTGLFFAYANLRAIGDRPPTVDLNKWQYVRFTSAFIVLKLAKVVGIAALSHVVGLLPCLHGLVGLFHLLAPSDEMAVLQHLKLGSLPAELSVAACMGAVAHGVFEQAYEKSAISEVALQALAYTHAQARAVRDIDRLLAGIRAAERIQSIAYDIDHDESVPRRRFEISDAADVHRALSLAENLAVEHAQNPLHVKFEGLHIDSAELHRYAAIKMKEAGLGVDVNASDDSYEDVVALSQALLNPSAAVATHTAPVGVKTHDLSQAELAHQHAEADIEVHATARAHGTMLSLMRRRYIAEVQLIAQKIDKLPTQAVDLLPKKFTHMQLNPGIGLSGATYTPEFVEIQRRKAAARLEAEGEVLGLQKKLALLNLAMFITTHPDELAKMTHQGRKPKGNEAVTANNDRMRIGRMAAKYACDPQTSDSDTAAELAPGQSLSPESQYASTSTNRLEFVKTRAKLAAAQIKLHAASAAQERSSDWVQPGAGLIDATHRPGPRAVAKLAQFMVMDAPLFNMPFWGIQSLRSYVVRRRFHAVMANSKR